MALRIIRTVGDDVLRKTCREVDDVDDRIRKLLSDMAETMYNTKNGAGLAAPQIGILKRLVVIDMGDGLVNLVNPIIVENSGTHDVIEGCLSVPGRWGKVKRPKKVKVKALNEKGEEVIISADGEYAKCICHEIDHLDGILFIDKVIEYVDF